jgi:methionyl-tRNA formyltransferase
MKILFAGTPDFSVPPLEKILQAGHRVAAVYTQPDRQAGRGRKTRPGPVKKFAEEHGLSIQQPATLKQEAEKLKSYDADVMVVVAYGLLLPAEILAIPRYGCLNIHASLLPRWRGAAPIQRAIEAGDSESGITIMQMDAGLDTGDILARFPVPISGSDTGESLHDRLSQTGAEAIVEVLDKLDHYRTNSRPQDDTLATYARKISKDEGNIDWNQDAAQIERKIRAFTPWPGCQTWYENVKLGIRRAEAVDETHNANPGQVLKADKTGILIACGSGCLRLLELQRPGGRAVPYRDFLNGMPLQTGTILSSTGNE